MKYIDADKLIAEIERMKKHSQESKMEFVDIGYTQNAFAEDCRIISFDKILSFINSLQQEQPVEIKVAYPDNPKRKEIRFYYNKKEVSWEDMLLADRMHDYPYYFRDGMDYYPFMPEQKPAECGEDERIRKEIIAFLTHYHTGQGNSVAYDNAWITYLEKQKEQKPVEWSEDYCEEDLQTRFAFYTYKDEDSVLYLSNVFVEETSRNKGLGTKILAAAEKVAETLGIVTIRLKVKQDSPANAWYRKHGYGYLTFEDGYDWLEKTLEYLKPFKQERSEEDEKIVEKVIDVLKVYMRNPLACYSKDYVKDLINKLKSLRPQPKQEWGEEDEKMLKDTIRAIYLAYPYALDDENPRKKNIDWLKSLRPQPKQEWSEEDEKQLNDIIRLLPGLDIRHSWLKSLKDKVQSTSHWKPSKEQIEVLEYYMYALICNKNKEILFDLYNDLKKL